VPRHHLKGGTALGEAHDVKTRHTGRQVECHIAHSVAAVGERFTGLAKWRERLGVSSITAMRGISTAPCSGFEGPSA